jgi:hypothetical protein
VQRHMKRGCWCGNWSGAAERLEEEERFSWHDGCGKLLGACRKKRDFFLWGRWLRKLLERRFFMGHESGGSHHLFLSFYGWGGGVLETA